MPGSADGDGGSRADGKKKRKRSENVITIDDDVDGGSQDEIEAQLVAAAVRESLSPVKGHLGDGKKSRFG